MTKKMKTKDPAVTLKGFKHLESASHDSTCFEATVYVDGKKFCTASDDGWGGEVRYASAGTNTELQDAIFKIGRRFNKNCIRHYKDRAEVKHEPWIDDDKERHAAHDKEMRESDNVTGFQVFDHLVSEAITNELYKVDLKKSLSRRVVWLDRNDNCIYQTKSVKAATRDRWIPQVEEREAGRGKDIVILNTLPINEAVEIYRSSAS